MNKRSILLLLVLGCLIFGGCQKKEQEKTEITLIHGWGTMEDEHIRMREIYKDFEKKHPDIKLNLMSMTSSGEVIEKVGNMLSVGEVPDLIFTGGYGKDSVYRFMVEKGKALDLLPYLKKDEEFQKNIAPEIISYWNENEQLYTLSDVLLAAGGYWYNEDIFQQVGIQKVPETWEEFFDVCDQIQEWSKINDNEIKPVFVTQENSMYLLDALLLDYKEYPVALDALKRMNQYDKEAEKEYGYRDVGSMFNAQKTAIYINGVWAGKLVDESINAKYAVFPGKSGQSTSCLSACLGYVVGDTGNEKKMEASVEFLKYIMSKDVQERILLETGQMPSNPRIRLKNFKEQEPRLYQAVEEVRKADRRLEVPSNLWTTEQIQFFQNGILDVLESEVDEKEFIEEFKKK